MKQPALLKRVLITFAIAFSVQLFAQNLVPFTPRFDISVKGDMLLIGNNNLSLHETNPYNGGGTNDALDSSVYVDIDGDVSTFNSSSANLDVPDSAAGCYQVAFAGLYWTSIIAGDTEPSQIKFMTPGGGGYMDIVGTEVYFQNSDLRGTSQIPVSHNSSLGNRSLSNTFIYFHDVTEIISELTNPEGTYTVANISSIEDQDFNDYANNNSINVTNVRNVEGLSAGWSLFIIYEDPNLTSKNITVFDGFTKIERFAREDITISGFRTIDTGAVRAKFAFSALEGDSGYAGDYLEINGTRIDATNSAGNTIRPDYNFFNSSVSYIDPITGFPESYIDRNPASTNTLGFDAGIFSIPNASNSVIDNEDTSAIISVGSDGELFSTYFNAFSVEIIAPDIILTKIVEDGDGNDVGGQTVDLGTQLFYTIGFENQGNDDAKDLIIRDILPENTIFDYPSDLGVIPPGITHTYNPSTRELIFTIDDSVVEENDPKLEIRFGVTVVATCSLLNNACSNIINNEAFSTYFGTVDPDFEISDDPSFNTNTGCLLIPQATNFLSDLDNCVFEEEVTLCGEEVVLTAGDGYDSYLWSTGETTQSITVTSSGTYTVANTAIAPCQSIDQVFNVITFGEGVPNPVIPFQTDQEFCVDNGLFLPIINLCGGDASVSIETGITDTSSIVWEVLDESSCPSIDDDGCANTNIACTWIEVEAGPDYLADTAGQYRLTLNYTGGCFNQYFFNVFKNDFTPTAVAEDIICTSPGSITVNNVPAGYEYSLDDVTYQPSNVFSITTGGLYTVFLRQIDVTPNPCIFEVEVQVRERDFTVTPDVTQPLCNGQLGSVVVDANDADPQYHFSIYDDGGILIDQTALINENSYEFENLAPGTYTVYVTTNDVRFGSDVVCEGSTIINIIEPMELEATATLTTPLACTDGEITINVDGGTTPYNYFINGSTTFQTSPTIAVTSPGGVYDIRVEDRNGCSVETSITVEENAPPEFTVSETNVLCYNESTGSIDFNVTNANGYTIEFSIDGGTTYSSSSSYPNLPAGAYSTSIRYTLGTAECFSVPEDVEITEPDTALTASGGVSELAGCGPDGEGTLRITNPQGGTPPYEYSFDNQATWQTSNSAEVFPGTYTLYIRDANECIFDMPGIVLDPEPVPPTIDLGETLYNCDGTGTATVTVDNAGGASYEYIYLLDGVENPNTADPTTFLNVPDGNHTVTVGYTLVDVPTFSNLLIEDFGFGESTTSPGIDFYIYESQVRPGPGRDAISVNDGEYSVTSNIESPFGAWWNPVDHTTGDRSTEGRYLLVNIGDPSTTAGISLEDNFYKKEITDIIPNQPIRVDLFVTNIFRSTRTGIEPDLLIALVDPATGNIVSSITTGNIPNDQTWNEHNLELNPGAFTTLDFVVRTNIFGIFGNDIAIDDISVYQLPISCITEVNFPITIDSNNAFRAEVTGTSNVLCSGENNGSITIDVQNFDTTTGYDYSTDGGTTWTTETTSPLVVNGLTAGDQTVIVRFDDSGDCEFSFTETITEPDPVTVTATATPVTCLDNATVTAVASNGTPAYSYQLLEAGTLTLVFNFPANGVLTNVEPGTYIVRVTDANDCEADMATPLVIDGVTNPTATIDAASDYCYDPVDGATLIVNASGGSAPYKYSSNGGTTYVDSNTFADLIPGTYDIIIRDNNNCESPVITETIAPQLQLGSAVTKTLDCTTTPDAEITVTASEGTAPYAYQVSSDGGTTYTNLTDTTASFTYTVSTSGTYDFIVTDVLGCVTESSATVNPISNPTATTTDRNPTCNGFTNGSIQIIPSGGEVPYQYAFVTTTFTSTSFYDNLGAGTYAYQVRDANGCIFNGTVVLTAPSSVEATDVVLPFSCSATNTNVAATITVTATAGTGTGSYEYSFNGSGYSGTNVLTVNDTGVDQTINYSVRDANGCVFNDTVTLTALAPPTDLDFVSTTVTCNATTSDVTITPTGGVGILTYTIEVPATATTNVTGASSGVFTGLIPDTYIFRVTDENGCYYEESHIITPVTNIDVLGSLVSDVSCNGDNDGAIRFEVSGFAGTYSYTINTDPTVTGQTATIINETNLTAGTYTIVITDDATGCTDTASVVVTEPAMSLTIDPPVATNVHCDDDMSQITITATGGTPNYTYAVVLNGATAPLDTDYASGNVITVDTDSATNLVWDVYVRDVNGCTEMVTVTIISDALPTLNPITQQCYEGTDLTVTLVGTVTVGTAEYSMGSGFQASPTFTVTEPGTYTFTIRDDNGCIDTETLVVEPQLIASALLDKDLTCSVPTDATIDVTVSGGITPYTTYEVSTDGGLTYSSITPTLVGSTFTYSTSIAGTYQFRISDSNSPSCFVETNEETVNPIVFPDITGVTQIQDILCSGQETGAIDVTLDTTLGLAPFTINVSHVVDNSISPPYTVITNYGTQTSGLPAGDYVITVTDAKGCTDEDIITLTEPNPIDFRLIKVDITCDPLGGGSQFGSITVSGPGSDPDPATPVEGGTAPFRYFVTNNFGDNITPYPYVATSNESFTFDVIDFGVYTVTVVDANGCEMSQQITMASPPEDLEIDVTTLTSTCADGGGAVVEVTTAIPGINYEFGIAETNISPYTLTFLPPDIPGGTIRTFTMLTPGVTYTFVVHDIDSNCYFIKTADAPIEPASPMTSTVVPNNVACIGEDNGSVTLTLDNFDSTITSVDYRIRTAFTNVPIGITGNIPVTSGTPETVTIPSPGALPPGQYYVEFTENGAGPFDTCTSASDIFEINESTLPLSITSITSSNVFCTNDESQITVIATGGTTAYTYAVVQTGATAPDVDTDYSAGNTITVDTNSGADLVWDVYVKDANNCVVFATETIILDPEPTIATVPQQCYDGNPIMIQLVEDSGIAITPLTYSIGGAFQTSDTFTISTPGNYTLTIQDGNGCTVSTPYTVEPQLQLLAELPKELDCTPTPDGTIVLTPSGGTGSGPYAYEVRYNGGAYAVIGGTPYAATVAGTYQFRVTDSQTPACSAESNIITVNPIVNPTHLVIPENVSCNGGNDGIITVNASGGVGPYEYSIDGGLTYQPSNVFSGLTASPTIYNIMVRDSKSCTSTPAIVPITEPTLVTVSLGLTQGLTCGAGNATQAALLTAVGSNGTPPYMYSFNGGTFTTTDTFTTNTPGSVSVVVRDNNLCISVLDTETVPALDPPTDLDFVSTPVTCNNVTSTVTLTTTNGVTPFGYEILSPATATTNVTGAASGIFTGLAPDTYLFRVTDANGCTYEESYTVDPVTNIAVSGLLEADVSCNTLADGEVTFTVSGYTGTYTPNLITGTLGSGTITQTGNTVTLSGLAVGTYEIEVTDDITGCTATATIPVAEPIAVTLIETENINANCNLGAQVTVEASGGASPYRYAFVQNGVIPIPTDYTPIPSRILDATASTDWDVYVLDINDCPRMIDVTITTDPLPTVTLPTVAANQCNLNGDPYTFTVVSTIGVGPFEYSIDGGLSYQTSDTFTVNTPGTYTVTVKDNNDCTAPSSTTIDIYPPIDLTPQITALPSCDDDDGAITVDAIGGTGAYTYSISPTAPSIILTGNVFSGVPSGTYTITVTDADPTVACSNTTEAILGAATPVAFTPVPTNVTCEGDSDGSITVNVTAGDTPYTYQLTSGPLGFTLPPSQTLNIFDGLPAGDYDVTVTSGRNCVETLPVTVGTPMTIVVDPPAVQEYGCTVGTNESNLATITVNTVTGGSNTYTIYEFLYSDGTEAQKGTSNVYTESGFAGDTYTINVYDDNGCVGSITATIQPFINIEAIDVNVDNAITCTNDEDITVSVTTNTGVIPTNMEYSVEYVEADGITINTGIYGQTNTTGVFTGLPIGNYFVAATNLDTDCIIRSTHFVTDPNTFDLNIDNIEDVTCFVDNDGSADITFIDRIDPDDSGAFNYTVFNTLNTPLDTSDDIIEISDATTNAGPITIANLVAGTYRVVATLQNTPFCEVSRSFTITAPNAPLEIFETHKEITCIPGDDGTITASATGGWSNDYEYQLERGTSILEPYSSVFEFRGLSAGNYTVRVRDSQDCSVSVGVSLQVPTPINATVTTPTPLLSCFNDSNGIIEVTGVTGGQGSNYSYTLNMVSPLMTSSGPQLSNTFEGLIAGTYNVTITDGFNCSFTSTNIVIAEPNQVIASLIEASSPTCTTDATLTLSATGGTGTYEYSIDESFTTSTAFTGAITFSVTVGTYQYYVRDVNNCISNISNGITVDPIDDLLLELDVEATNTIINCAGDTNGTIVAVATGGLGNYIYSIADVTSGTPIDITLTTTQDSPGVFTSLGEGIYRISVTSEDCTTPPLDVPIVEPYPIPLTVVPLAMNVTCTGADNGELLVDVEGGTGNYQYAISPQLDQFVDDPADVFENLAPGEYLAIVQDIDPTGGTLGGCFELIDFEITEPSPVILLVDPTSIVPEHCNGDMDGSFSVTISGGEAPYSVSLDDVTYVTGDLTQTQFDFTALSGGDKTVYVLDNAGCESEWEIDFPDSVLIIAEASINYCTDSSDTSSNVVTINADEEAVDLAELTYALDGGAYQTSNMFSDVVSGPHTVMVRHTNTCTVPVDFIVDSFDPLTLILEQGELNQIVALADGGSGNYQYELNGESHGDTNEFIYYESGDYTVTVIDSNGCMTSVTQYFEFIDVCITNYFTPNGDGNQDEWGAGCTINYPNLKISVFDRYGRKIITMGVNEKWNGKYNGKELPTGDYWYVVKLNDENYQGDGEFVGHFTLYR